ncbi:hypothetical protein KUTeg_011219 [Tegillarca granosa]|uniref:Tyrosine-protein phosphatase domain-containing protein n=1 Tax=Tegillarca granosa TaxID=220873 RepID=A0ABQ9F1D6_TEGGR|nr:hypothetical protein KUTeg_011219 [Tegillarca granosa]
MFSLPLVSIQDEHRPSIPNLIDQLQNKIEMDDPVEEYKELRHIKPTDNCDTAKLPENKVKNRFRNVLPYDINRVMLSSEPDYINASHIIMNVGESECHYIACQGPLPNTTEDFWQMVWEQEVDIIAMLTLDMESRKVKCHRYWPESSEGPLFVCEKISICFVIVPVLKLYSAVPTSLVEVVEVFSDRNKHFIM